MGLTPIQADLLDSLTHAVERIAGVDAIWLSGSLASGEGDEFSDIDVHVAMSVDSSGDAVERWAEVARSAGAVFARATPGQGGVMVNAVTPEGFRFDLVVHPTSDLKRGIAGPVKVLRDPQGILAALPRRDTRGTPRPEQVVAWTEEFLRCLLLLGVVAPREEWISAEAGSLWMLRLLTDLMLAENSDAGAGSALRLGRRLTEEQKRALSGLPALTPTRRSVVNFQTALAAQFLPRARSLCLRLGAEYPEAFEAAVRRRLGDLLSPLPSAESRPPVAERPAASGSARYDAIAEFYDQRHRDVVDDTATAALLDLLGPVAGRRILDLACGQGRLARELARRGASAVIGVDLSERLIQIAERREAESPLGASYLVGDVSAADRLSRLSDQPFDAVACNMALTDFEDLGGSLSTVNKLLGPGGTFVFSILHPCFPGAGPIAGSWDPDRGYTLEGWWTTGGSGIRGKVGSHHRPLGTIFNCLAENGLSVDRVLEPPWSMGAELPALELVPGFLVVRCIRHGA